MTEVAEACDECLVRDALGRHDPMCPRALRLGLLRLAEGEEPIEPGEVDEDAAVERAEEAEMANEREPVVIRSQQEFVERFGPGPGTERDSFGDEPEPELWISFRLDGVSFDATVFGSELSALRHAVHHGESVHPLELGRSLREQVGGGRAKGAESAVQAAGGDPAARAVPADLQPHHALRGPETT